MINLDAIAKVQAALAWFGSDAADGCGPPTDSDMVCTEETYYRAFALDKHQYFESTTGTRFRSTHNLIPYNTFRVLYSSLCKLGDSVGVGCVTAPAWVYALGEECVLIITVGNSTTDPCLMEVFERGEEYSQICEDLVKRLETDGWVFVQEHDCWWVKSRQRSINGVVETLDHSFFIRQILPTLE